MKKFLPFLVLVLVKFTGPEGDPVYVVPGSVTDVTPYREDDLLFGRKQVNTRIRTNNGYLIVRETPSEVVKRLGDAQ